MSQIRGLTAPAGANTAVLPAIPPIAETKDGQIFDATDDLWTLRKHVDGGSRLSVDWSRLTNLSPRMRHLAKLIVASRASGYAALSTRNDFEMLKRLDGWTEKSPLEWTDVTPALGRAWLDHGVANTANAGNDFARLRDLYGYGALVLNHADFDAATYMRLKAMKAPGNTKGQAVREADPEKGHLTPPEMELIEHAIAKLVGDEHDLVLVHLAYQTGRNALQYTLLKESDLTRVPAGSPHSTAWMYKIYFPRIKKRGTRHEVDERGDERTARRAVPIDQPLGDHLWSLRRGNPKGPLLWWIDDKQPENDLGLRMQRWAREANLISPRTGEPLHLNPRRFRVTLATNAADQGASMEHLAELLDHTDLQNVKVYIDRSPRFLERIDEEIDAIYDPIVRRFRGTVGTREEATRRALPVIPGVAGHMLLDVGGVGACGQKSACKLSAPLACYSCESFVAFREGPHAQVVASLEQAMTAMEPRVALQLAPVLAAAREVVAATSSPNAEVRA